MRGTKPSGGIGRPSAAIGAVVLAALPGPPAWAQPAAASTSAPQRPEIRPIRWEEDWGALADPRLRTEPLDALKYVPVGPDPDDYVSLGGNERERYEHQGGRLLGVAPAAATDAVLSRLDVHLDLRIDGFESFVQLEDARAPGLGRPSMVDVDRGDLKQAFLAYRTSTGPWSLTAQLGRQEIAFDTERFVTLRDGANVRQVYDGVTARLDGGAWSVEAVLTHPVVSRAGAFDDLSNGHAVFDAVRVERRDRAWGDISAYYARFERPAAQLGTASGDEVRDLVEARYARARGPLSLDLEAMAQAGRIARTPVRAWAMGARGAYALSLPWRPQAGLQLDAASGDGGGARRVGTFEPPGQNNLYFNQAGFTGYSNLLHIKPSLTIRPSSALTLLAAAGVQWRVTTSDAVYVASSTPLPGTAGTPGRFTGGYGQLRAELRLSHNIALNLECDRFLPSAALGRAGARATDYLALELGSAW